MTKVDGVSVLVTTLYGEEAEEGQFENEATGSVSGIQRWN
jgi:hypothetical protein